MSKLKVLSYAPYHAWTLHGQWELTILHALRLRGAETQLVMCDGLYTDCDIHHDTTLPRTANSCNNCQASCAALGAGMGTPYRWLGGYLELLERSKARQWADSLDPSQYRDACYGDWQIGEWVLPSVHSHLRTTSLDMARPRHREVFSSYLYSGLIACFGLTRLLDHEKPDVLLLFNGRFSSTRCAFELAQRRSIRVVCHERGCRMETLRLFEQEICMSVAPAQRLWHEWGDAAMSSEELDTIHELMAERARGNDHGWEAFSPPPQEVEALRQQLNLDSARPTWVVYTSSSDETCTQPDRIGAFPSHEEWLMRTIGWAARHPEVDMVIRTHPNTGGKASTGRNDDLLTWLNELSKNLPHNVRMVMPDDAVSSYTLMDIANVGLVHSSTTSLEMACRGKVVVMGGAGWCSGLPFVRTVVERDDYDPMLDALLEVPVNGYFPEVREQAYRYAYGIYYRWQIPFPLVEMPDPHRGKLRYKNLDALAPGRDEHLDRICRIVLEREAVVPKPTEHERVRYRSQERSWWDRHHTHA